MPGAWSPSWARLISRLDFEVFFLGTAIVYTLLAPVETGKISADELRRLSVSLLFLHLEILQGSELVHETAGGTYTGTSIEISPANWTESLAFFLA